LAKDCQESEIARRYPSHFETRGRLNRSIEWRSLADGWRNPGTREPALDSNLCTCPGEPLKEGSQPYLEQDSCSSGRKSFFFLVGPCFTLPCCPPRSVTRAVPVVAQPGAMGGRYNDALPSNARSGWRDRIACGKGLFERLVQQRFSGAQKSRDAVRAYEAHP
jgi:hypothetical protein